MTDLTSASDQPLPPPPLPQHVPRERREPPSLPSLDYKQLVGVVVAAVLGQIGLRANVGALSTTLGVLLIVGVVLWPQLRTSRTATVFGAGAVVFAVWLPLRASAWLVALNVAAIAAFLAAAAATVSPLSLRLSTGTLGTITKRLLQARYFFLVLFDAAVPLRSGKITRLAPLLRGVLIAALPVAILTALLASADAAFAGSIAIDMSPGPVFSHVVLTVLAVAAIAGLIAVTGERDEPSWDGTRPFGAVEALVLLASIAVVYAWFAVVQLLSALGKTGGLLAERGVSYSEWARDGFFQLLWVAGLTVVLLVLVRLLVVDGVGTLHQLVRGTGALVALLTTLIVATAIVRLDVYTAEFGQTSLRWYCTAFAWMLGVAFVLIAASHARRFEHSLPVALITALAITLFAVNVLNPDARVVEHNLARSDATEELDTNYVTGLSADAWPALLDERELVVSQSSELSFTARCLEAAESNGYSVFGFNLGIERVSC